MTILNVRLKNFKAHDQLSMNIGRIHGLLGRNNVGKTSVLAALAFPTYQFEEDPALPIGTPLDLVGARKDSTEVSLRYEGCDEDFIIKVERDGSVTKHWSSGPTSRPKTGDAARRKVFYLSASRVPERQFRRGHAGPFVGIRGQHAPTILAELAQHNRPRFNAILKALRDCGLDVRNLEIRSDEGETFDLAVEGRYTTPLIMQGSGISSVLPILVQAEICEPGSTLLLEEPESHLHYETMSALWRFLLQKASQGLQIVFTTHSVEMLDSLSKVARGGKQGWVRLSHFRRESDGSADYSDWNIEYFRDCKPYMIRDLEGGDR